MDIRIVSSLKYSNIHIWGNLCTHLSIYITKSGITLADVAKIFSKMMVNIYTPNHDFGEFQLLHIGIVTFGILFFREFM